jgi:dihydrofolate synthase / folylpolyglutamate synthase
MTSALTLDQWLEYQQQQHSKTIDMSLERVRAVAAQMALQKPAPLVITVAGTNGKGSTVAFLRAILTHLGLRVGSYTSPHILHYRERITLPERPASDTELIAAFEVIERARHAAGAAAIPLTFFEFATLAALEIFAHAALDVVVLEVGLGGRLDAVNIVDADGVILTTVDLDHQEYLGPTRTDIGREKAGVFRWDQTVVYADDSPVEEVLQIAKKIGADLIRARLHYRITANPEAAPPSWDLQFPDAQNHTFDYPQLAAPVQLKNAAAALVLIEALKAKLPAHAPWNLAAARAGVRAASLPGRLQQVGVRPAIYLDVAHNPQAADSLAKWLHAAPIYGHTYAVYGGLMDKNVLGVVAELSRYVHGWFLAGLEQDTPRGYSAIALAAQVRGQTNGNYEAFANTAIALDAAIQKAKSNDRILVFGSFFVIAAAFRALRLEP